MRYLGLVLILLFSGCVSGPTVIGHYKEREGFRCFGLLSKYEKVPERYVSGGPGSIKDKEGNEATRSKAAALVDIGSVLSSTQPTTEVK